MQALLTGSLLGALCAQVSANAIYTKNSPVLQVSGKDFSSVIEQSNHTSIVEFYAPWCGHCQSLKPAYEKAAKNLAGLAKVAAINCDEESNKPFCGRMGVQGFPTLKIVKPGSKKGKPVIEDYQGERSAKAIVDAVLNKIPNHVKKLQDAGLNTWLEEGTHAKVILFTEKGTIAPLVKALAIDFLGTIDFATIRNKEQEAIKKYSIMKFPTVVLVPGTGKEPVTYDGELKKDALVRFLAQVASPNLDPAPIMKKAKVGTSKGAKPSSSASAKFSKASSTHKASDYDEHMQAHTIELNDDTPTVSPLPIVEPNAKPMVIKDAAPAIPQLSSAELESACLSSKSGTCVLVLLPPRDTTDTIPPLAAEVLASFAEVAEKHHKRKSNIFPFYAVPADNEAGKYIRKELALKKETEVEVVALNMKRKWWRPFPATGYDIADADNFVDAIKLGEGSKQKLPNALLSGKKTATEEPAAPQVVAEPVAEDSQSSEPVAAAPEPVPTAEATVHDEL